MIIIAMVCTVLAGILGSFLEPTALGVSIPVAVMGGFIIKLVYIKIDEAITLYPCPQNADTPAQGPENENEEKADEVK